MKKRTRTELVILIAILIFLFASCSKNQNRANLLNPDVKYRADTMYAHHRMELTNELDSLCEVRMPDLVFASRDSLLELNRAQIDKMLNRN